MGATYDRADDHPEGAADLRTMYDHMRDAATRERGLPPVREEHTPNRHLVSGLPATVDGAVAQVALGASRYQAKGYDRDYDQDSVGVTWRSGNCGVSVSITIDNIAGTLTPSVVQVTYGSTWGQTSEPVIDAATRARYLAEADQLVRSL